MKLGIKLIGVLILHFPVCVCVRGVITKKTQKSTQLIVKRRTGFVKIYNNDSLTISYHRANKCLPDSVQHLVSFSS